MFSQSIRIKMVLWYMLVLSITLIIFSFFLYHNFSRQLKRDMDELLKANASGIVDSIDAYWQAEWHEIAEGSLKTSEKSNNINFFKIAQRWINEKKADANFTDFAVFIFDAKGHLIATSKNVQSLGIPKEVFNGQSSYDHWRLEDPGGKPVTLRRFTVPVMEKGRVAYLVQVASSLRPMHAALDHLVLLLAVLLPLTVALTGAAGLFFARLALNPVHQMIETIDQIKAENLALRIPVPVTKDEIKELAITFNDMIERLDRSFTAQQRFMQDIAHELKTPLAILKGELEVTLNKVRSAAEYETILLSNLEEVNRLARIVDDLLILARFDTKTAVLNKELLNMTDLLKVCVEDMRVLAEGKNISIVFTQQENIVLKGDRGQIRRLILNLLDNAIKYTPGAGKITIDLYRDGVDVRMNIADTGVGIPLKELTRIFDRFYRVDKARSAGGFGLGLSIVKSIADAHGGRINVTSVVRQGTIFTLLLPAV